MTDSSRWLARSSRRLDRSSRLLTDAYHGQGELFSEGSPAIAGLKSIRLRQFILAVYKDPCREFPYVIPI